MTTPDGQTGRFIDFINADGTLVETRTLPTPYLTALDRYPKELVPGWTGRTRFPLKPRTSGLHTLFLSSPGKAVLSVDGNIVIETDPAPAQRDDFLHLAFHKLCRRTQMKMAAGAEYEFKIEYESTNEQLFATEYAIEGIE